MMESSQNATLRFMTCSKLSPPGVAAVTKLSIHALISSTGISDQALISHCPKSISMSRSSIYNVTIRPEYFLRHKLGHFAAADERTGEEKDVAGAGNRVVV